MVDIFWVFGHIQASTSSVCLYGLSETTQKIHRNPWFIMGLVTFGFLFLEGFFFFAAGFGLFLGFLVLCFPVSLLFFFSAFPASLLFCFSVFPASLLLYFCAFLLLLLYFFFSSVMCFCCSTFCSLLLCFLSLLSLCFPFSFALFCSVCILNETLERP